MFFKVINELQLDFIIVWGYRAYNALTNNKWNNGPDYYNRFYTLNNNYITK